MILLLISVLVGSVSLHSMHHDDRMEVFAQHQADDYDYSWAMEGVNKTQIREYLMELSKEPHMAGLDRDELLAAWLKDQWEEAGLDSVKLEGYSMLLDYPDKDKPNYVKLVDGKGEVIYTSHYKEEGVDDPNFVDAFNAYSKNGTAEGNPVYVNFGRIEDFQYLEATYGSALTQNKICLARYGKIYRGNKAENAAVAGCVGLVIFMDPSTVAMEGQDDENLFPNTFWASGTAVQRGSLSLSDGDPLTPTWPSLDDAYRLDEEDRQKYLPRIPVQPVGYTDAEQFLSRMAGVPAPVDWQGGINITYMVGGSLIEDCKDCVLTIEVNNVQEQKVSSNVVGMLWGSEEPDKYVMLGNHRDAWGFGAVDPSSGTAQLMEVVRVLAARHKSTGWRPRRTMMFLSWGAEEYSLCGSREFVEQYEAKLVSRGVAYLNTDICMTGPILSPVASPTLASLIVPALHDIWSPEDDEESYYSFWRRWSGEEAQGDDWNPEVNPFVGAGSDHASFQFYAGIPVVDIFFVEDSKIYPKMSGYPAYHTGLETFDLVDKIYDPEYKMFRTCSQLNLRLGLELAESTLLPFTMSNYAEVMEGGMEDLASQGVIDKLEELNIETSHWNASISAFREAAEKFDVHAQDVLKSGVEQDIRVVNEQIRGFERTLLLLEGLPDRVQYRHMVTAPSMFDAYGGSAFPGVGDLLFGLEKLEGTEKKERIKKLAKHVSDLMITIQQAAEFLEPIPTVGGIKSGSGLKSQSVVICLIVSMFLYF